MDYMEYPTVPIVGDRGLIPHVPLPVGFLELVPRFYEEGRRGTVER